MSAALAWLLGTRLGRWLAAAAGLALAVWAALWRARMQGREDVRKEAAEKQAQAIKDRKDIEESVDAMDDDTLAAHLSEWVRRPER